MRRVAGRLSVGAIVFIAVACGVRFSARDPMSANAGCYVCHMTFVNEEISRRHLAARIGCVHCHGTSAAHANDENVGATPPDIVIARGRINEQCRACHKHHDVAPERMIDRWHEHGRRSEGQEALAPSATCTDCHGTHRITKDDSTRKSTAG